MINNEHKDRLFNYIFGRSDHKEWTLSLYNALNGSHFSNADDIELNTIDDAVYMGMKNDTSFLLHWTINLWAHQSTFNPNMPVRELMYLGKLYDKYIKQHKLNIYGHKLINLPIPNIVIFYNGKDDVEDEIICRLSDSFHSEMKKTVSDVEVVTHLYNINKDHNRHLMTACRPLFEYSWFIEKIRSFVKDHSIEEAVDITIDAMPNSFVIKPFLIGNRAEVKDMCITEYDEVETMQMFKEEAYSEGFAEGHSEGFTEGHSEGFTEGHSEGFTEGHSEGFTEGHSEGFTEGHSAGFTEGHSEGFAEGHSEGHRQDAMRMYADGLTVNKIAQYVGETVDIVRSWLKDTPVPV